MAPGLLDQLSHLIFTDDLTGLYNRRYMHYLMREASAKGSLPSLSLLVIDLDRFKSINDTYGHADGDAVLRQFSKILAETVPSGHTLVRYGGDEFIVMLQNVAKPLALEIAEAVRQAVHKKVFAIGKMGQDVKVGVSIGVASAPEDAPRFDHLFEEADKALYFAKKTGRGRVAAAGRYDPSQVLDRTVHEQLAHPALADRKIEMEEIGRTLQYGNQGQPRFMLLSGDAGSGKSRLLREALQLAKTKDMIYVFTRCAEYHAPSPYRVLLNLVQVFGNLHPESIKPQLAQLSDEVFATVCEVIPDLSKVAEREPAAPPANEGQKRRYLFAALARIIWQLAQERCLAILIDNLHHIDQGTLEVVRWLLTARKARIIFMATLPSEVLAAPAFKRGYVSLFLEECSVEPYYSSRTLEPLGSDDLTAMIRSLLPNAALTDSFVGTLVDLSRGNPLYVTSAIRYLLMTGKISFEQGRWTVGEIDRAGIPASLEDLLRKLFDTLDQEAVDFLSNAAVAGESFHIDTLRGTLDQNEGQLLDVVDRLMRQNLIDSPDARLATDFEFLSQKARNVSYDALPQDELQRVHQKVGEAEEKRLQDSPDAAADVLAYHFGKSGDQKRAQKYQKALDQRKDRIFREKEIDDYQTVTPSEEEARLPEGTQKLDPRGLSLVGSLCRNLMNTIKIHRVYPAGTPAVQQARQALGVALEDVFALVHTMTLSQTEESLAVNTDEVPITAFEGYISQIRILFTEKYIKSLTFGRGITAEELAAVVSMLATKVDPQLILSDDQFWAKKLDAAHVRRADITPLVFVPETDGSSDEGDIDAALVDAIKSFLKSFKGSVEALRFYPPGSAVIRENIQNLLTTLGLIFQRWSDITLSLAEGRLVVNTIPADEVRFGPIVTELVSLMETRKLTSLTLNKGITVRDVDLLTRGLWNKEIATEQALIDYLNQNTVLHIIVGERTIALKTFGSQLGRQVETRTPVEMAEQWLKLDDDRVTGETVLYQLASLLDSLYASERADLAEALIARYYQLIFHRDATLAARAAEALDRLVHLGGHKTSGAATQRMQANLRSVLAVTVAAPVRRHFVPLAPACVAAEIEAGNWESAADLLEILRAQPEAPLQENIRHLLEKMQAEEALAPLWAAFRSASSRGPVSRALRALGPLAEGPLARLILEAAEPSLIEAAAPLLKEINPVAWKTLAASTTVQSKPSECLNTLKALAVIARGQADFGRLLVALGRHPESLVRFEALKFADAVDPASATQVIRAAIESGDNALILQALSQAVSLGLTDVGPVVQELLRRSTEESMIVACCRYAQHLPRAESMPDLLRILERRPRFFGLVKGLKGETRAEALLAIAALRIPESDSIIERSLKEKSIEVRAAARSALPRADATPPPGA